MKHKRQTVSKTDEEDNKDSLKGDDDSQPCSKFHFLLYYFQNFKRNLRFSFNWFILFLCFSLFFLQNQTNFLENHKKKHSLEDALTPDSSSKKSCQGCELPSHDIPDSTSNSRGHNNNTPSATNNNNSKNLGNGTKNS